jgi:thiol:disulfide interchange protein DsbD
MNSWMQKYHVIFLSAVLPVAAHAQEKAPDVGLSLVPSVEAIAPGEAFDVGIRFELPDEFHIYWENPGDSGLAPSVQWSLPRGFTAGRLHFPVPDRHVASGLVTNVLSGSPMLVATITPPADMPVGSPVEIKADVSWLVCRQSCFKQDRVVSVTVATDQASKPVAGDTALQWKIARRALPAPPGKGSYVTIQPTVTDPVINLRDRFELVLDVTVKEGYHAQSNKPLSEFFVPSTVFVKSIDGVVFDSPVWPEAHVRKDKILGQVSEFTGKIQVRVPAVVESPTTSENVTIAGLLRYQACDENGRCYPPEAVEWSTQVKSESVRAAKDGERPAAAGANTAEAGTDHGTPTPGGAPETAQGESAGPADGEASGAITFDQTELSAGERLVQKGLIGAIIAGFIGGLILNIMPCVLPVISIKILSFVQQAGDDPKRVFKLGLVFSAGVILSFLILAGAILGIQAQTQTAQSWGVLFQSTAFVVGMIIVVFAFALNLFGVFEVMLPGRATAKLAGATEREGLPGAFMKGVLATLLATPCTAPFLFSAMSFALASSPLVVLLIFASAGVGMASPYLLLTAKPAWMRYLPKPGPWMVSFKQFMGFLLVGTAVWLLVVLGGLRGVDGVVWMVAFLAFLGLGCWMFGRIQFGWSTARKAVMCGLALGVVGLGGCFAYRQAQPSELKWVDYRKGLAEELANEGRYVYVDYTAKWCATCQINKAWALHDRSVVARFNALDVVPIKADYTNYDEDIADDLKAFKRDAVPLNVIYPPGRPDRPIVLPVLLTPGDVLEALEKAAQAAS